MEREKSYSEVENSNGQNDKILLSAEAGDNFCSRRLLHALPLDHQLTTVSFILYILPSQSHLHFLPSIFHFSCTVIQLPPCNVTS